MLQGWEFSVFASNPTERMVVLSVVAFVKHLQHGGWPHVSGHSTKHASLRWHSTKQEDFGLHSTTHASFGMALQSCLQAAQLMKKESSAPEACHTQAIP